MRDTKKLTIYQKCRGEACADFSSLVDSFIGDETDAGFARDIALATCNARARAKRIESGSSVVCAATVPVESLQETSQPEPIGVPNA
jgi:hypothetical protein